MFKRIIEFVSLRTIELARVYRKSKKTVKGDFCSISNHFENVTDLTDWTSLLGFLSESARIRIIRQIRGLLLRILAGAQLARNMLGDVAGGVRSAGAASALA